MNMFKNAILWTCLLVLAAGVSSAQADILTIPMTVTYSGVAPSGPKSPVPWIHAYLNDSEQNGTLRLWIEALGLVDSEFVSNVYLNLDSAYDVTQLQFSQFAVATGQADEPTVSLGQDAFKAGGGGRYDIELSFTTSNAQQGARRFGAGEKLSFLVGMGGQFLTLDAFFISGTPDGGHGPFIAAAHIQGIGPDAEDSAWISHGETEEEAPAIVPAPEPFTSSLLIAGAGGLLARRRRAA